MQNIPLTPGDYWEIVKRRKWGFVLTAVMVLIICGATAFLLPSIYRSYATIMIEEQQIPSDFVMTTVNTYAEQRVENIKQRVMSFTQLWDIITRFNLYPDLREKWTPEEVVEKMREDVGVATISAEIFDRRSGKATVITTAFTVSYEGKKPKAVLQVTDTLTSLFLEQNLQVRQQRVTETSDFLAAEAERVNEELAVADRLVSEFKEKNINQLPELFQVNVQGLNGVERILERLNSELGTLEERQGYLEVQLVNTTPYLEDLADKRRNQAKIKDLQVQLAGLRQRYSDHYPDVGLLEAQIQQLKMQKEAQAAQKSDSLPSFESADNPAYVTLSSQLAGVEVDIEGVKKQIASYEERAEMYRLRIESSPRVEEEYMTLVNRRNALQVKFNDLNQKHQEARVAQELEKDQKGERFTLIEPARLPEKAHKPNRLAILLIGGVLAIGAGVGFGALREFTDQSTRSIDHLMALTGAPVFTGIPPIVTADEKRRKRIRRLRNWLVLAVALVLAVIVFHYFIMDLDIFWAKVGRRLDRL